MADNRIRLRRVYRFRVAVVIAVQISVGFPVMPLLPRLLHATNTMPNMQSWPGVLQLVFGLSINIVPAVLVSTLVGYALYIGLGLPKLRRKVHRVEQICPECDYSLAGITSGACPECGTDIPGSGATA